MKSFNRLIPLSPKQVQLDLEGNKFITVNVCDLWKDFDDTHLEVRKISGKL